MAQNEIKPEPPPNCAAADGVKMRSPKPNRRSSSFVNPEHRSGRFELNIALLLVASRVLQF